VAYEVKEMKDSYTQVAITPIFDNMTKRIRCYEVKVIGPHSPTIDFREGSYLNPKDALSAGDFPLRKDLYKKFLQILLDGQKVTFSLEDSLLFE
jgi:hypothetical protein